MCFNKLKKYILLYCACFIYSGATICAKLAATQSTTFKLLMFFGLEFVCLGVYAIIWQQVLKRFTLVTGMASKGVVVIFNLIWSVLLFSETITIGNILGAGIIIFGIWMVSISD